MALLHQTLISGWIPPSRENWELICRVFALMPVVTVAQWLIEWFPQGKTSTTSPLNLPGKLAWSTMETPGFVVLLYTMATLPAQLGISSLPSENWLLAALFTIHYLNRAWYTPLFLAPSMSPIHPFIWLAAVAFQLANGLSIGGYLAGHGPVRSAEDWTVSMPRVYVGVLLWAVGLAGNIWHEDELREIRRAAKRRMAEGDANGTGRKNGVDKYYDIPSNGLFRWVLYAHYTCEWLEWAGFWLAAGWDCGPARTFLINEISTMVPRAVQGKQWYIKKFGVDRVGSRKAVIPGLL